ncbi:peptidase M56 BlaR1 [Thermoclostridium stercorarium subsp. stercorarium DSM 8532]|uniref:Peptidase M56 BlaR1 n=2 Tax=Thermoclostridium stercorarium TaxID=1510 RepID=L7VKG1_THES1|nr:M56 family metallopeptidase [Thermoclostridium stercorarium]AGC67232.1 peptidase M56 BlaR1 [Thermoclostridium stercorarium subsp. stercorarium DSM 8532]AGI38303.1 antirepressor membrane subunit [Thermoclostridium stercorarium subsp. stercorarium DSM 8532]ANW97740.1 peptidase M56 BlaR1 [Thermoclostridium stercorarium subsp. thermolacticum DSM 2910]
MKDFMIMLITYSAALSPVILSYAALTSLLSKRYSAKGLYYSWLVIVIGLIVPYRPQICAGIINSSNNNKIIPENNIFPGFSAVSISHLNNKVFPRFPLQGKWWTFIFAVWLCGIMFFLSYQCFKHLRLVKAFNRWSKEIKNEKTASILKKVMRDLALSGKIKLLSCPYAGSPVLIGLFNPRIIIPEQDYTDDELYFILRHELVHYKRRDLWYKSLILLATAIHWFNPAVYIMAKIVGMQCELSCDEYVVSGMDAATRYRYCETLIGIFKKQTLMSTALTTNFYGGKNGMKRRILSIMNEGKRKIGLFIAGILLAVVIGAGFYCKAVNPADTLTPSSGKFNAAVSIKMAGMENTRENTGTSVRYVDPRPSLEFYIEGENIAKIDISCENEYLAAIDWTKTQHRKYWDVNYYQTFDEETQASVFYPDKYFDKTISLSFNEDFTDYQNIWYRWHALNLYEWALENNYSRFFGYGSGQKIKMPDNPTEDQKLMLAAGNDGSGLTGLGHIQLSGYPDELTKDRITVKITDRTGNTITKLINVKISNNEFNETVVTAYLEN